MNKERFFDEVVAELRSRIADGNLFAVETKEVMKTNDEKLHGICICLAETNIAPTVYLEDILPEDLNESAVKEVADRVLAISACAYKDAPDIENMPMSYEDIKDKLVVQLVDSDLNRERLKELVYSPVENGFVMIPYIVLKEDMDGSMRAAVTKMMAKEFDYDVDKLMETALLNTIEKCEPSFLSMGSMIGFDDMTRGSNPMSSDFKIDPNAGMYILTNSARFNGASVMFYPEMAKRIGDVLGDNYYALPSSLHEFIILPEYGAPDLKDLQSMVKEANRTVVDAKDVLSDRVFFFDRDREKLVEPKAKERNADERGER